MKKFLIAVVIIIVIVLAFLYLEPAKRESIDQSADTTESITKDLDSVDVGGLDADFNSLDEDINSL